MQSVNTFCFNCYERARAERGAGKKACCDKVSACRLKTYRFTVDPRVPMRARQKECLRQQSSTCLLEE